MTVTQSYSLSLTYTSLRMYVPQTTPSAVPASSENRPAEPAGDRVTLSREATAPPAVTETPSSAQPEGSTNGTVAPPAPQTPPVEAPGPVASPAPPSRAARRAEVLLDAVDANEDGSATKEEFVDGAMALLRRAGARHRHHHHHHHRAHGEGHDRGHEGHGMRRLERKLDRLFERIDASGDGNVDQAELTDALAKVTRERRVNTPQAPVPSTSQETPSPAPSQTVPPTSSSPQVPAPTNTPPTPPAATMSYTSVTVVIAVKQYTSVAAMNA